MLYNQILAQIKSHADKEKSKILSSFFKTGKWQYWEWDKFLWLTVPTQRKIAKEFFKQTDLQTIDKLIKNEYHEIRLTSLFILVEKYKKDEDKQEIFNLYIKNAKYINNWDLVDLTAPTIVWEYFFDKDRSPLYKMMKSKNLWEKRIVILATFYFIKNNEFQDTINMCEYFLNDKEDLIQKACGWMLREMGKRQVEPLLEFLDKFHKIMPRTMLRYSIEKFDQNTRKHYMQK